MLLTIACQHRIEWAMTFITVEAFFVPHWSFCKLLLSCKNSSSATRTTSSISRLDGCCAWDDEGTVLCNVILTKFQYKNSNSLKLLTKNQRIKWITPLGISLEETRTTSKSIAMRTPLLAITSSTVNILVRPITSYDRVQSLFAVIALEAFFMPFSSLGQHHFSSKNGSTTTWTAFTFRSLDWSSIGYRCFWSMRFAIETLRKIDKIKRF